MPIPASTRREFLRNAALASPLVVGCLREAAAGPATVATAPQLPASPDQAFPLIEVAPADDHAIRKSEASAVELRDGSVLLAYATHAGRGDNAPAPIVCKQLSAEGQPLTDERVIVSPPPGGLNAMSPALKRLPDGRIGMLFSYRQSVQDASRRFTSSKDEGGTWSAPVVVADGHYKTGCHDRFTVHSSGRLLAPCHCSDDWTKHYLHVRVSRSDDLGATWTLSDPIMLPRVEWPEGTGGGRIESGCIEPGIAERADGSLIMTIRTAMGTQFKCESFDRGESWKSLRSMEVVSPIAPAHISRMPGGDDLLLLWTSDYDARASGMGRRHTISACVSHDGGATWPHASRKVLVREGDRSVDYPSVLYKGHEAWITLRISTGTGVLEGRTSTYLMRVPLPWFTAA